MSIVVARFKLGRVVCTQGVNNSIAEDSRFAKFVMESLGRHSRSDWGNTGKDDQTANERALVDGSRLFSAYEVAGLTKIWIITEAIGDDGCRASTCILFPDEY